MLEEVIQAGFPLSAAFLKDVFVVKIMTFNLNSSVFFFVRSYFRFINMHIGRLFKHKQISDQDSALNGLAHVCDPWCPDLQLIPKNPS